ncbi:PepSY domain-containing protein [Aureimonas glaciei]|nr:PepSY domain-containing protein [Aureimonas glaciei]
MAQNIEIGPNGVRLVQPETEIRRDRDRDRRPDRREISEREAIRIARGEGLRDVDRVRRTDRAYRISGSDRRGRDIQVVVDRRRGDVISVR